MSMRSELGGWVWGFVLAMPAVGLFLAGRFSTGWVSIASFVLLLAYVVVGLAYGLVTQVRTWQEMEDEIDGRDCEAEQDDE